jgi:hypothetical protein
MAVPTWSQLTFLSAGQQAKAAEFAAIGAAYALFRSGRGPKPDISGVTYSQAKAAEAILRDLGALVIPAQMGIRYVREVEKQTALDALEAANP